MYCIYILLIALLKENTFLSFDILESEYGRKIENANDDDLVVLIINEEKIYLKKVYG